MKNSKISHLLKTLGPGIMFAGTCIGGSHLMQSTKAGAFYCFGLLSIVLIANFFKYPFFEFASRYTNATGKSILDGYRKIHITAIIVFGIATVITMFIITAAIGALTGGLFNNLVNSFIAINLGSFANWSLAIFIIVLLLLSYGKFSILDVALKVIGLVLVITICAAFFSVISTKPLPQSEFNTFEILNTTAGFTFAVALMGWMPMGVDMSAWHSIWTEERIKQTGYHPTLKETLLDFKIGYAITVILALFFLTIGAYVLYQHPIYTVGAISNMSGVEYASTLVAMFTEAVGNWSNYIIQVAAFATMFGTSITLIDGYSRSMVKMIELLRTEQSETKLNKLAYLLWAVLIVIGSYLIIHFFGKRIGDLLNFATATSFIVAPIAAFLNYKIIFNKNFPKSHEPSKSLKYLAISGLIFLTIFTSIYISTFFNIF